MYNYSNLEEKLYMLEAETKVETLHKGKFVSLMLHDNPKFKYEFTHEHRCGGHIVAVLPIHPDRGMLVRHEFTSCWDLEKLNLSSITGGWEQSRHPTPIDTVIEELREEAGIILNDEDQIMSLGTCRGAKSSDNMYHLFAADLSSGFSEVDIETDGSHLESLAHNEWMPHGLQMDSLNGVQWFDEGVDPLLYVLYTRFRFNIENLRVASRSDYK